MANSLKSNPNNIMNLNLSYNSITFKEAQMDQFFNSEDFFESFCEYLEKTQSLNHIDLSGLNFEREQLQVLCPLLNAVNTLVAIHLSDMDIKRNLDDPDNDLMLEVLDHFGIDEAYAKEQQHTVNQATEHPDQLKSVIKNHYNMLESQEILNEASGISTLDYQNHLVMAK
jgi:hypothetical protein